jgi:hypothetical protein
MDKSVLGNSHMSDIRQMSVAVQRLVDFIPWKPTVSYYATIPEPTVRYYATIPESSQPWKEAAISVASTQTL